MLYIRQVEDPSIEVAIEYETGTGSLIPQHEPMIAGLPGIIYAKVLPEGTYEIYRHSAKSIRGWLTNREPYSFQFTVKAGQVVYLGRIITAHESTTGLIGLPAPGGFKWSVEDHYETDRAILAQEYPTVLWPEGLLSSLEGTQAPNRIKN